VTPLEVATVLLAAGLLLLFLGVLWADALDRESEVDWEAEEYADLVSTKHDAANEILGYTAWGVEMMHHAASAAPFQRSSNQRPNNNADIVDAEFSVQNDRRSA
jgi:hypothetical protein